MPEAVIVDTVRTPIGRAFKGSLAQLRPEETGAYVIDQLLERNPDVDPATVNEVFAGCGMPQGLQAFNVARIMTLLSEKLPKETTAVTMSRYCASSLDSIRHAANSIKAGQGDTYVAAGVEWVSRFNERTEPAGAADRNPNLIGENGQPNAYIDMGITAVNVAKKYEVSRADMDKYAQRSQELAVKSQEDGFFDREIVAVKDQDGNEVVKDDGPRASSTLEKLSELPEAFEGGGGVTAGNSCPLNDGAAAVLMMSDERAKELGLKPRAKVITAATHGNEPELMGVAPIGAIKTVLERADMKIGDVGRRGAERGLRRPGDPDHGRVRHPAREAEHPRRRDRPRPPVRHDRRPHHGHPAERDGDRRPPGRHRDHVRRRRPGRGDDRRAAELAVSGGLMLTLGGRRGWPPGRDI